MEALGGLAGGALTGAFYVCPGTRHVFVLTGHIIPIGLTEKLQSFALSAPSIVSASLLCLVAPCVLWLACLSHASAMLSKVQRNSH